MQLTNTTSQWNDITLADLVIEFDRDREHQLVRSADNVFTPAGTQLDAAVAQARTAARTFTQWTDGLGTTVNNAQAVLQAQDGSLYITPLGSTYRTSGGRTAWQRTYIDGQMSATYDPDSRMSAGVVDAKMYTSIPELVAVVGADRTIVPTATHV